TLIVNQLTGRARRSVCGAVSLFVAGTIAATGGSGPPAFDPASQDLRVLIGESANAQVLLITAGDSGWKQTGNSLHWSFPYQYGRFWRPTLVLDIERRTFRIRVGLSTGSFGRLAKTVAVNFEFGAFRGGDVRAW